MPCSDLPPIFSFQYSSQCLSLRCWLREPSDPQDLWQVSTGQRQCLSISSAVRLNLFFRFSSLRSPSCISSPFFSSLENLLLSSLRSLTSSRIWDISTTLARQSRQYQWQQLKLVSISVVADSIISFQRKYIYYNCRLTPLITNNSTSIYILCVSQIQQFILYQQKVSKNMGPVAIAIPLGASLTVSEVVTATAVAIGAAVAADQLNRRGGGGSFKCRICGGWHAGLHSNSVCYQCWDKGYR